MSPIFSTLRDYREAAAAFSRPARLFLASTIFSWAGFGVHYVLFNLYLVEAGFTESFVGRAISLNALGLAIAALPAGWLANRWGRRRCLILGGVLDGLALLARSMVLEPNVIYAASFLAGVGQSLIAIAAAPYISEHSTPRERTHLFSAFFACELLAGVAGNLLGGWLPVLFMRLSAAGDPQLFHAYRIALVIGAGLELASALPLLRLRGVPEAVLEGGRKPGDSRARRRLVPIALNALLIGAGAGLVIPFMNLYFKTRFECSSGQIGVIFSIAQVSTAVAALLAPAFAKRFGKLNAAVGFQLLSLPFLVTLGAERHLAIAAVAFWMRATLMQASIPLVNAFVMEAMPPALRAHSSSLINLLWNIGWAVSATGSGALIQRFGYAVPFYITAALYGIAAVMFYLNFRDLGGTQEPPSLTEEAKGLRGTGPLSE